MTTGVVGRALALSTMLFALSLAPSSFADETAAALPPVRIPHAPILIQGDLGFLLPTSGVADPLALGTSDDPFVIEGWRIVGAPGGLRTGPSGYAAAIQIRDTTRHVVIRDSTIETLDDLRSVGIWLVNASNVTVQGVTFQSQLGTWVGVTNPSLGIVWDGAQVLVEAASRDVRVEDSLFDGGSVGVVVGGGSRDVRVAGNSFVAPRGAAVYATSAGAGLEVASNLVRDGARTAFLVAYGSSPARIHDNDVTTTYLPIQLYASTGIVVEGNRFRDNWYGGLLDSATGNILRNNAIDHTYYDGLQIRASSANALENNTIRDAGNRGIWILGASANNTLAHNSISTSAGSAVLVSSSSATKIHANAFSRNGGAVHLDSAPSSTIRGNNLNANGVGVRVSSSGTIDATMNWWGSASGPGTTGADGLVGSASVSPWLTSAAPDAGARPASR